LKSGYFSKNKEIFLEAQELTALKNQFKEYNNGT
jgi:hypothetical protein